MKHAFLSFESAYTSENHRDVHSSSVENNIQRAALRTPSMYRTSINNDKSNFACSHEAKFLFSGWLTLSQYTAYIFKAVKVDAKE